MNKDKPETVPAGNADDVVSDPGKGTDERSDWADEGGATNEGPATGTDEE